MVLPVSASSSNLLPRLNYGIVFQEEASLTLSKEYWLHTFEVSLPQHVHFPAIGACHKDKDTCQIISHVLSQLNAIRVETSARLNNTLSTIRKLVPHADIVKASRSRRSLLPFIGKFSKTLFGTATVDDVNVLAGHINALNRKTQTLTDALVQHGKHLSSFMAQSNKRMDNLLEGVKQNHIAIQYIDAQLHQNAKTVQETFTYMTSILVKQMETSNTLNHELDELKLAVVDLANGKLSPLIIPLDVLQSTLNNVQSILSQNYSGFFVTVKSASELYHSSNFLYTRNNSMLYLTLKIPISYSKDSLILYKVVSVPVPVNDTSKHATQLLDVHDYFAITQNQQFYVQLSESVVSTCKGTHHKHCHVNVPLDPVTKDSCLLALYANNKNSIQQFCNFRFVHDVIVPRVMELSSNKVLLYDSPILSMECNGTHTMMHGCNFCIFDLPCQCSLSTPNFYLPARLISCSSSTSHGITKLHPVNLILLQKFFNNDQFQHIFADSTFLSPLNVTVPQFNIYNHEMSKVLADDVKNHLNLSKMVEIAKNDDIVFQTLAEPILDGQLAIKADWPDFNGILTLVALSFAVATTVVLVWMFFKLRRLSAALIVLQQIQNVKALHTTLPSFVYTQKPTTASVNYFDFNISLSWEHANFLFLILNTLLLMVLVLKLVKFRRAPMLMLEVTSVNQCVFIPIMKLPTCPSLVTMNIPESVTHIQICGSKLFPKIQLNWTDFSALSPTENIYSVPTKVKINVWQSLKLSKILKKPFFINLHTEHCGYLSPLTLSQS